MFNNAQKQHELQEIYQSLEHSSTQQVIIGLKKLRKTKLDYRTISFLLGMSWFHENSMIRRRVKYLVFREVSEDFARFLKGRWRFLPHPPLPKVWELMEYLQLHPQIDSNLLARWAYRPYYQSNQLRLNQCDLHYLSSELGALKHLKTLDLSQNNLLTLPPELGKLKKLEKLLLANNQIVILPTQIKKLKKLQVLDLSANKGLNNLPREFSNLAKLTTLNLSKNNFKTVPVSVCVLQNLTTLDFSQNHLTQLPSEFVQLTRIKQLNLSHNQIQALPIPLLTSLDNLSTLDISGNPITKLPLALHQLPHLKRVIVKQIPALSVDKRELTKAFAPVQLIF